MSNAETLLPKRILELHFARRSPGLVLVKIVFGDPTFQEPIVSLIDEGTGTFCSFKTFKWSTSSKALSLLILLAKRSQIEGSYLPSISGSPAEALLNAISDGDRWLLDVFGYDTQKQPLCAQLLQQSLEDNNVHLSINDRFLPPRAITVTIDGEPITTTQRASYLATKIEEQLPLPTFPRQSRNRSLKSVRTLSVNYSPKRPTDEMRHACSQELSAKVLSIFPNKATNRTSDTEFGELITKIRSGLKQELCVWSLQHTEISLLDNRGTALITSRFDIQNAGVRPMLSRTHRIWFESSQQNVNIVCRNRDEHLIPYQIIRCLPNFREVNIRFPSPLRPLEKFSYSLNYEIQGDGRSTFTWTMSPRTITRRLMLTVSAPNTWNLPDAYVTHESRDGYLKDETPEILIRRHGDLQELHWEIENPSPGDLIRTYLESSEKICEQFESSTIQE